jgi:hypothetical protein
MIKEFFTDPFGLKRIAELQSQVRYQRERLGMQAEKIDDYRDEIGALRKVIQDMLRHEKP